MVGDDMNDNERRKVVEAFLQAWGNADVDGLMALMAESCVYFVSTGPEPGLTVSGEQALRNVFADMTATETEVETREGRIWVSGEHAFAEWSYDEKQDDGQIKEIRGIDVIHILGGKILSIDAYRKST